MAGAGLLGAWNSAGQGVDELNWTKTGQRELSTRCPVLVSGRAVCLPGSTVCGPGVAQEGHLLQQVTLLVHSLPKFRSVQLTAWLNLAENGRHEILECALPSRQAIGHTRPNVRPAVRAATRWPYAFRSYRLDHEKKVLLMTSSGAESCSPEPLPPWLFGGPHRPSLLRIKVVVIVIVLTFAGLLLLLGYDLQAALTSSLAAVLAAGEVARRVLGSR